MTFLDSPDQYPPTMVFLKRSEEAYLTAAVDELIHKFHCMDPASTGLVGEKNLGLYFYQRHGKHFAGHHHTVKLSDVIRKLNLAKDFVNIDDSPARQTKLSFEAFFEMMRAEDLTETLGDECADAICIVRNHLLVDSATTMVSKKTVASESVRYQAQDGILFYKLEFAELVAVAFNAILIGISIDYNPGWTGYILIEAHMRIHDEEEWIEAVF